jgi:hypothetical protein
VAESVGAVPATFAPRRRPDWSKVLTNENRQVPTTPGEEGSKKKATENRGNASGQ